MPEEETKTEEIAAEAQDAAEEKPAEPEKAKVSQFDGVVKGKYQWDSDFKNKTGADNDLAGEAITKYSWSDGKKTVSVYVEMDGLDDVADSALKAESGENECSLTIEAIGTPARKRTLRLNGLANEIDGVKLVRKPGKNTVVLKLVKKEEKSWWKLLDDAGAGKGDDEDEGGSMGGMGGMMGGMGGGGMMGGMGGMDMESMMGGMGGMGGMMGGMGGMMGM